MADDSVSPLQSLPFLGTLESKFNSDGAIKWLNDTLHIPVAAICIYLVLVYVGRKWMANRKPYNLKRPLFLWNVLLAVFSILGTTNSLPSLVKAVFKYGIPYTACKSEVLWNPHICIWGFCYVLSKILELGDTFFIVLRKSRLIFLHWYHHVTIVVISWYSFGKGISGQLHWFGSVNYFVHSIMYSYYALAAGGVHFPATVALLITILQLLQMFIGISIDISLYTYHNHYDNCDYNAGVFWFALLMYLSYAILFGHYFYNRYIRKKSKKQ